jgi:hypothetical protein
MCFYSGMAGFSIRFELQIKLTGYMKQLLDYFSRLGTKYNLNFSGQEILKDHILGLDGIQRKLLVLSGIHSGHLHDCIIDLNEVRNCSLKKYYGRILANELRSKKLEQYLEKIWLHIDFNTGQQGADILFYKQADQPIDELPNLEQKARRWKDLLSKLKPVQAKKSIPQ